MKIGLESSHEVYADWTRETIKVEEQDCGPYEDINMAVEKRRFQFSRTVSAQAGQDEKSARTTASKGRIIF